MSVQSEYDIAHIDKLIWDFRFSVYSRMAMMLSISLIAGVSHTCVTQDNLIK